MAPDAADRLRTAFARVQASAGGDCLVSKRIANNRRIPVLVEAFPDARFVNLVRDGRAVAYSLTAIPGVGIRVSEAVADLAGVSKTERLGNLSEEQTDNTYDVLRNDWVVFTDATLPGSATAVETGAPATEAGEPDVGGEQ